MLPLACADSGSEGAITTCLPELEGVPVVASGTEGLWSSEGRTPRLVELWRAGGLREGEELAYPVGLAVSPEGRVAVTDFSLSEVIVIEPDGRWSGPWARRGKGPGELSTPVTSSWTPDGTLTIFDLTASKILFLKNGESVRPDLPVSGAVTTAIYLAGELPWVGVQPEGGVLLQPPRRPLESDVSAPQHLVSLLRYAPAAEIADTIVRFTRPSAAFVSGAPAPGWPRLSPAVASDGSFAVAGVDSRYRITVYDSAGSAIRQICRDAPPLPLNPFELGDTMSGELPAEMISALKAAPRPDTLAAVGRLFWGVGGRLWVQRERSSMFHGDFLGVPGATYDVFGPEGHYLGAVTAPPATRLQGALGDTVFAFETGAFDETAVVAYRLVLD